MESGIQSSPLKPGPGRPRAERPVMFVDAKTEYLHWLRKPPKECARNTLKTATRILNCWEAFLGFSFDLRAITNKHCENYMQHRRDAGVERSTINLEISRIGAMLNYLVNFREPPLLPYMPINVSRLKFKKVEQPPRTIVSDPSMRRLVQAAGETSPKLGEMSRGTVAVLIAFHVGFRHQEICHLQRYNVDLDNNMLTIDKKPQVGFRIKNHETRAVPMSPELRKALEAWLEAMPDKKPEAWLFPGYGGYKPMSSLYDDAAAAFDGAGLSRAEQRPGLHSLRRTWATNLLQQTDIETVRQAGGWADLKTVQRYLNSTTERMRKAVKGLPSVMQPAAEPELAPSADSAAVLAKLALVMTPEELANVARKLLQS